MWAGTEIIWSSDIVQIDNQHESPVFQEEGWLLYVQLLKLFNQYFFSFFLEQKYCEYFNCRYFTEWQNSAKI